MKTDTLKLSHRVALSLAEDGPQSLRILSSKLGVPRDAVHWILFCRPKLFRRRGVLWELKESKA